MSLKRFILNYLSLPVIRNEISYCFYVENKARLGEYHVIHANFCELLPEETGRKKLGSHENFDEVLKAGKNHFDHLHLCTFCCKSLYDTLN